MADGPGNETLRQMLQGFNSMQSALGLLPMSSGSPAIGLGAGAMAPPPPPRVLSPAEAAQHALARHTEMAQQTLAAAQMTRFAPPPSSPTPSAAGMGFGWGGTMGQMASQQLNPFMAGALGGSGFGMPNPVMMTPPSFGMFRPGAGPIPMHGGPMRMPSIFNPFAPTMPHSHFASPGMHSLHMMQMQHSQMASFGAGVAEFGFGAGGALAGGMLGSAFGPIGTIAGGWLGSKIGGGLANMALGPATADIARGRMIQGMTAPFIVSGSHLSTMGQGLSTSAAREVAMGVRMLQRDHEFERTGFNTADTMRIMSGASQQGLLTGVQNPDEIVRRVKEISKSVKVLMQITGDPDVQSALASLGQMRNLGFQGLSAQSGAVANRAMFARMAGVSQGAMHDMFGMPGAMMAQQVGLVGATGYSAGMAGGALANIAASSGALNDLQLARAGGRSGLGQINTMAQISAMQSDIHLMASLRRGSKGLEVDMDAYRRAQGMSVSEVAREAAERTRAMGAEGIFEWRTRRQEFKDQIAQKLSPFEMNMNVVRQAQALQKQVPGMNLGSAIFATVQSNAVGAGMSEEQAEQTARALELQFTNRNFWEGQKAQLRAQRRQVIDQERARFEQFRTPGLMTRTGRAVRGFLGDVSDTLSSPYRRFEDHMRRVREDEEAAGYGERISRISDVAIAHDPEERAMMMESLRSRRFQQAYVSGATSTLGTGTGARMLNRVGSFLGVSSTSGANRAVSLASESFGSPFGMHPFGSFGSTQEAVERMNDVSGAAQAIRASESFDKTKRMAMLQKLDATAGSGKTGAVMIGATSNLARRIGDLTAGTVNSATALSRSDLRKAYVDAAVAAGQDADAAGKSFDANPSIATDMVSRVMATGSDKAKEVLGRSLELGTKFGAVDFTRSREGLRKTIKEKLSLAGFDSDLSEKTLARLGKTFAHHSAEEIAIMSAQIASTSTDKTISARGQKDLQKLRARLGDARFDKLMSEAIDTAKGLSADEQKALGSLSAKGEGLLLERVKVGKLGLSDKKAGAAMDALMQRIGEVARDKSIAGIDNPMEAIEKLVDSGGLADLEESDPELAKLLKAARGGDKDALARAAARVAPSTRETRYGSRVSSIDRRMAEVDEALAATSEGGDGTRLQAESSKLFADSVKTFADAVKDLKGTSEAAALAKNSPWWQSMMPSPGGS